ncbi:MAG: PepSY domain-containing protein, partial [Nitrospiria bacterium]
TLRSDAGMLLYDVRARSSDGKVHRTLLDANSGHWLSPLNEETALRFARQYVPGTPPVEAVSLQEAWIPRKKSQGRPAWVVRFGDAGETEIVIDPVTGAILEDQDSVRRFHFFIMKLHQFNFFGFKKVLTIIPGLPLLIAILTGGIMWATPKWRNYAKKRTVKASPESETSQAERA